MTETLESASRVTGKKSVKMEDKLLVSRREAAERLSISERAVDYLIAGGALRTRRIGARVLIPNADLRQFAGADHPKRLAS
jgi:excisionase family DNA binding protein